MNFAKFAIEKRTVTLVLTVVMLLGGLSSYKGLSRLEDPEFTIKDALVITPYPGASAREVEEEVSDELEIAVQKLGQLDQVESKSDRGLSTLTVSIKKKYDRDALPQVWDELRRKVGDAQQSLPPGAGPSIVVDDYGDVYGVFVAIYGDEFSYAELMDYVELLRRELFLVQDVAKVEIFGARKEAIFIELQRDRMAQLGIPETVIIDELQKKSVVSNSGRVRVGPEYIAIEASGTPNAVKEFESILVRSQGGTQIYLRNIAEVKRGYLEPPDSILRFDGQLAIGLGISTVSGGNVVAMGEGLSARLKELQAETPLGMEFGIVSLQSKAVSTAISGFVNSLAQAVAIVIVVLLFFMGLRSGFLIGFVLVLTICGTFIFMAPMGVALERISLGALIIALGMLVDNAIVVVDGVLMRLQKGEDAAEAACEVVEQTSTPLLGATIIGIMAFAAIGTSQDSTGEFCRSLYQVVLVSLLLSWVTAVTVTPVLCVMFLKPPKAGAEDEDPYSSGFYAKYRGFLSACIQKRLITVAIVVGLFVASLWGFGFVDQSFFPSSTRPQFMVDYWLPQGTHIDVTQEEAGRIEEFLEEQEGVTHVTSLLGQGGLRFLLTYTPEKKNSSYAQFLVDVDDYRVIEGLAPKVEAYIAKEHPEALGYVTKYQLGPGGNGLVQARFSGPDRNVVRSLASQAEAIFKDDGNAKAIRTSWRQRVKVIRPQVAETQANEHGLSRADISRTILEGYDGAMVSVYREGDELLPIVMRAEEGQRQDVSSIQSLQIWSPAAQTMIPMRQVVSGFETDFEDEIIVRIDRKRTMTVYCDPQSGPASKLFQRVRPQVEAIPLPPGYALEWGGEYEDSGEAQAGLAASIPFFLLVMVLITIALFNSLRQPLVIWCCVPLALIGVTSGLLVTGQPFGFMALLGFLSLSGMLIKNAIVLIDQINLESNSGKALLPAIMDSGVSRLRPVAMAASTTALGMIPLLLDAFFISMAVTIIFGLIFATVLTMIVVPVLYAIFYGAASD